MSPGGAAAARRVPSNRWRRSETVLWRALTDGVVLLPAADPDTTVEPVVVTGPGLDIWRLLASPQTADELADALRGTYTDADDRLHGDVMAVLDQLARRGLLEAAP